MEPEPDLTLSIASVGAFLGELALLAAAGVAGARLGAGATSVLLAVVFPAVVVAVWGAWLAPRSARRLRHPSRLAAELALTLGAGVLLAVSGLPGWAVACAVGVGAVFTVAELQAARRAVGTD